MQAWAIRNFNSIKVRLKHAIFARIYFKLEFQFHKGTIKTLKSNQRHITTNKISIP